MVGFACDLRLEGFGRLMAAGAVPAGLAAVAVALLLYVVMFLGSERNQVKRITFTHARTHIEKIPKVLS